MHVYIHEDIHTYLITLYGYISAQSHSCACIYTFLHEQTHTYIHTKTLCSAVFESESRVRNSTTSKPNQSPFPNSRQISARNLSATSEEVGEAGCEVHSNVDIHMHADADVWIQEQLKSLRATCTRSWYVRAGFYSVLSLRVRA